MATFTGTLHTVIGNSVEQGSVEVALCGYGSSVPRANAQALFGEVTSKPADIVVAADGTFTGTVAGNDTIVPAGTYYTITIKDENGDIVQVNAYRFLGNTTSDLNVVDSYDPNQPPPPLPPLVTNQLLIIPASNAMAFDGTAYTAFKTTLTANVLAPTIANMLPGNLYTFIIVQDSAGTHRFSWASGMHNATNVCPEQNSTTVQTFVADEIEQLWAIGPGTWWTP